MAKTVSDLNYSLAYRLGQSTAPTSTTELAKWLNWFCRAIEVSLADEPMWFTKTIDTMQSVANQSTYSFPTDWRKTIQIKADGYKYDKVPQSEVYDRFEVPLSPVAILPSFVKRAYYEYGNSFVLVPPSGAAPSAKAVTSITRSSTTATVTTTTAHGFNTGDWVTIAGAAQTDYNGYFQIVVTGTTTFTYTVANSPTTPATGTITVTPDNIEIRYYNYPTLPTSTASSIVLPDNYESLIVSYAEARYWSAAHKRGKAADAFSEFTETLDRMKKENFRHRFGESNL